MAAPDHGVGQALAKLLGADKPPALFQFGIELLEVLLRQLVQWDLPQLRDDMPIDLALVTCLGGGTEFGLGPILIPEVQPLSKGHVGADLLRFGTAHGLQQRFQFFLTFSFGFGQDTFGFRKSSFVIADNRPSLPAPILALPYGASALFASLCHGFSSFPKICSRKPPTTSLAAFCISGVTWV